MQKNYLLDTNVLLYDPQAIFRFGNHNVVIPVEVIEEIDSFKRDISELGVNSRTVSQLLDQLTKKGSLGNGVAINSKGNLQIFAGKCEDFLQKRDLALRKSVDNRILNLALHLEKHFPEQATAIVSKNINLRIKAESLGIHSEEYAETNSSKVRIQSGFRVLSSDQEEIEKFRRLKTLNLDKDSFYPNEYILLKDNSETNRSEMGRVHSNQENKLVPLLNNHEGVLGIKPLNIGQCFAMDALLNDNIKLVTLLGKAGTGKTLLAVAAGLNEVLNRDRYTKLLISRPIMPLGKDIGYIPGDIEEKMKPWMQPIYDAIEMIKEQDRRSRKRRLPIDLLDSDEIGIEPLTYIRGRSIPHQFFIIDESQNLTPHEVKTIITRVGHGSKVVLTGDTEQIDNPYVDSLSNGFSYLVDRFAKETLSAHITLDKGERSELAEVATRIL